MDLAFDLQSDHSCAANQEPGHTFDATLARNLGWKFMSCSLRQEFGQLAALAPDWLFVLVQPISSQNGLLTQLLTLTTTQKFPPQPFLTGFPPG